MRQELNMVRTAQDLERKYNLAGMHEAFKLKDNTLTRVEQILQDFVNTIVGTLETFEGLEDGQIGTYFYKGVPSLETEPTTSWTDIYANHINDLYYDKDTGKAYTFTSSDGVFSWVEIEDADKVKVMALANATVDTKDSYRRLFLEQPVPPYDNGDLWLKDGVIYCCQISKPITEVYEVHDFIVSSQYAGDTLAIKNGKELEVLKGTVLKVIEDAEQFRVDLTDLDNDTTSSIELIKNALSTLITDENGQSMMKQTTDGWVFEMKNILETLTTTSEKVADLETDVTNNTSDVGDVEKVVKRLEEKTTNISLGQRDGKPSIILSAEGSNFKVEITNTAILFMEGASVPAHISNETLHIEKASIDQEIEIGSMAWVKRANGHISFMPKGVM